MLKLKVKSMVKNVLSAFVIMGGTYILFNLAFISAAFVINGTMQVMGRSEFDAPPIISIIIYMVLVVIIFWIVYISKLNNTIKAMFFSLALMIVLVGLGISLYGLSKAVVLGLGGLIVSIVLYALYRKKMVWQYYFATFFVSALGVLIVLRDIDI